MALSWTAYLLYHIRVHLSRGFQNFFQKSFEPVVREAFIRSLSQGLLIISHFLSLVKGVVKIFFGGLTGRLPFYPAFIILPAPIPPAPFPVGRGRIIVFLCKGLRPLHPRGWVGSGLEVGGEVVFDRMACPGRRGCGGWWWNARRGLDRAVAVLPRLYHPSCPHPPDPLPGGKGENHSFLMQGASPLASPGLGGKRHWRWAGRWRPAGGLLQRRGKVNLSSSNPAEAAKPILQHPASQPPCKSAREGWNRARTLVFNNNNSFGKVLGGSGDSFKSPPAYLPVSPYLPPCGFKKRQCVRCRTPCPGRGRGGGR